MIPWLRARDPFPPVDSALISPNGLLAAGADLSRTRLLDAYRHGIFPWYAHGEPVLWWSPDPRMVLFVEEFTVSRSFRKTLRAAAGDGATQVLCDRAFEAVIRACSEPRSGQEGTWITEQMIDAYCDLHDQQYAHSLEIWRDDVLCGGLYGVCIGRMFFGESMFSREANASKIALAALVQMVMRESICVIDCQQNTQHLASLGAREISRAEFRSRVMDATGKVGVDWSVYRSGNLNYLLSSY